MKLFHPLSIAESLQSRPFEQVKQEIELFLLPLIPFYFKNLSILQSLECIHYLNPSTSATGAFVSLIQELVSDFPCISSSLVLYNHLLAFWKPPSTTQGFGDLFPLYDYVTDPQTGQIADGIINQVKPRGEPLIPGRPSNLSSSFSSPSKKQSASSSFSLFKVAYQAVTSSTSQSIGYLVGPEKDMLDNYSDPKYVYLSNGNKFEFVVYQTAQGFTFVFLLSQHEGQVPFDYRDVAARLEKFSQSVDTTKLNEQKESCKHSFISYNEATLGFKASIAFSIPPGFFSLIREDANRLGINQMHLKTINHTVYRKTDQGILVCLADENTPNIQGAKDGGTWDLLGAVYRKL